MTSAATAYRTDLAGHGLPFGERDGDWITVASLVTSAADRADSDDPDERDAKNRAWNAAIETAIAAMGVEQLDRLAVREWADSWSGFDPLTLIAIAMDDAGARDLSRVVLDAVLRIRRGTPDLAYGRAMAQRARAAYYVGEQEVAADFYRQVETMGRRLRSVELRARAASGFVGFAQLRGNHPELLKAAQRSLRLAEQTAAPRIRWNARYAIMLSTALFRRFDEAMFHGWELFNLVRGDAVGEALALQALGQLLFEMGDIDSARAAFAAVVNRPLPARIMLATLGSLATVASLSPTHRSTLNWAVQEVLSLRGRQTVPWSYAAALLDCAVALRDVGDVARASELRDEAVMISRTHRFNALLYRGEAIQLDVVSAAPERAPVASATTEIVRSVRRLAPRRLPRHVRMIAAGTQP
jgi:tetratricopeptide (TPR) repeat protein